MAAYYNEFDSGAAAWLRELVKRGLIAPGDVDTRSISEVQPDDLKGYSQCHFFAGIGGWSLALRMAGVSDDQPLWTGSCPCQPFSNAGKRKGDVQWESLRVGGDFSADPRHLWPDFARLIAERRPSIVLGEQSSSVPGRAWLTAVRADLEDLGYAVGAADLCAAGVGAPHIRQRSYWVADSLRDGLQGRLREGPDSEREVARRPAGPRGGSDRVADDNRSGQHRLAECDAGPTQRDDRFVQVGCDAYGRRDPRLRDGSGWRDTEWVACMDGKSRPIEPGLVPLAHGLPARVVRLRGYGNAIVPEVAATFIEAALKV